MRVKVVLHASSLSGDEEREWEVGPFNQGVVFEHDDEHGATLLKDVASGREIAARDLGSGHWRLSTDAYGRHFKRVFIRGVS